MFWFGVDRFGSVDPFFVNLILFFFLKQMINKLVQSNVIIITFPTFSKYSIYEMLRLPEIISSQNDSGFPWIIWGILGSPKIQIIGFRSHAHIQKSRIHRNDGFLSFPQSNQKIISPAWSRIILRSFCPYLFYKFTIKMLRKSKQSPIFAIFWP